MTIFYKDNGNSRLHISSPKNRGKKTENKSKMKRVTVNRSDTLNPSSVSIYKLPMENSTWFLFNTKMMRSLRNLVKRPVN